MSNSDPQGLRWFWIRWLENATLLHLYPVKLIFVESFGIISSILYNLLQSVQVANIFDCFFISNSFLAIYAVDGKFSNRFLFTSFKTRPMNPINELVVTSERRNFS